MDDLIAFLKARLDEDEAAAQACAGDPAQATALKWSLPDHPSSHRAVEDEDGRVVVWDEGEPDEYQAAHIARHDPARVLREVAAKRAILELHKPDGNPADQWYGHDVRCTECGGVTGSPAIGERGFSRSWPCTTLRHLAAAWNDHPDYSADWKPS